MSPDPNALSEYLGAGIHAQFDGEKISLMVERTEPAVKIANVKYVERVVLDTVSFEALCRFADRCWPMQEQEP